MRLLVHVVYIRVAGHLHRRRTYYIRITHTEYLFEPLFILYLHWAYNIHTSINYYTRPRLCAVITYTSVLYYIIYYYKIIVYAQAQTTTTLRPRHAASSCRSLTFRYHPRPPALNASSACGSPFTVS